MPLNIYGMISTHLINNNNNKKKTRTVKKDAERIISHVKEERRIENINVSML